jgi:hypothetical protein
MTSQQEARPRGRPPVGTNVNYRLPAEIRQGLADAMRPGESEAAAVRRLLTVALSSALPGALRVAADCWDQMARDAHPDQADADTLNRASATARTLLDLLNRSPADTGRTLLDVLDASTPAAPARVFPTAQVGKTRGRRPRTTEGGTK